MRFTTILLVIPLISGVASALPAYRETGLRKRDIGEDSTIAQRAGAIRVDFSRLAATAQKSAQITQLQNMLAKMKPKLTAGDREIMKSQRYQKSDFDQKNRVSAILYK